MNCVQLIKHARHHICLPFVSNKSESIWRARVPYSTNQHISNQCKGNSNVYIARLFHNTSQRPVPFFIPPLLLKLTAPLTRLAAALGGRFLRTRWRKLPPEQRARIKATVSGNRRVLVIVAVTVTTFPTLYYASHLEFTPITGRIRFILFNASQLQEVAGIQWRNISDTMHEKKLPTTSPQHRRVERIARRILNSCGSKEVRALEWEVNVIDDEAINAFVMANGQMFVFTGMLRHAHDDNELAGVLGHEMAHAILHHSAEQLSQLGFVNVFSLVAVATLWMVIPTDWISVLLTYVETMLENVFVHLPYSRKLEREADHVGMLLAARACYDVRSVPHFWERMSQQHQGEHNLEWLSTHPSHQHRVEQLKGWIPEALQVQQNSHCSRLPDFIQTMLNRMNR